MTMSKKEVDAIMDNIRSMANELEQQTKKKESSNTKDKRKKCRNSRQT